MTYSDFSLAKVKNDFGLTLDESRNLFVDSKPVLPSATLKTLLRDYIPLTTSISTEKARSEFLIAPILAEVRRLLNNQISLFSGNEFNVDAQRGLQGFCDYIISGSKEQLYIRLIPNVSFTLIFNCQNSNCERQNNNCVPQNSNCEPQNSNCEPQNNNCVPQNSNCEPQNSNCEPQNNNCER